MYLYESGSLSTPGITDYDRKADGGKELQQTQGPRRLEGPTEQMHSVGLSPPSHEQADVEGNPGLLPLACPKGQNF